MSYLSNVRHFILFWRALSLILALSILLLLLAEQENTCQHVSQPASKPLGLVGYIEIHSHPASILPKQLIIFVHAIPGFMGHSYGSGNSTHRDELF